MNKKISQILILLVLAILYWLSNHFDFYNDDSNSYNNQESIQQLKSFYDKRISKKMIKISGITQKLLADDLIEPRHQKFIIKVDNMTLLVTHNIDLAQRINDLSEGDIVDIYGQYEWNNRGGILHWTHHDPKGRREGGWIVHNGTKYE